MQALILLEKQPSILFQSILN
ncbi:hypothetical protein AGR4B_Cc100035 [Agrobacterium tumefaciens str. CFBP 5621]|nr:hypothetical protein AGR4B_Cc100035 [Agrobacterium tumefaciens str. CFBP 5621]